MHVAITGASGLVGSRLRAALEADGHVVHPVVRRAPRAGEIRWSIPDGEVDAAALEGLDAVVHLAGAPIGRRWTAAVRKEIRASRVDGTALLCRALARLERKPGVLVSCSAVGFYGDTGDRVVDEDDPPGDNFLAEVAVAWEAATEPARDAGIRTAIVRSGIALAARGGMLATLLPLARCGLLGPVGSGRQWVPWVDLDDLVRIYRHCLDHPVVGPVNGVAPNPVRQRDFARAVGRAVGRPAVLPAPGFAVTALYGQMGRELILEGQRCTPRVLLDAGFAWDHPELDGALAHALGGR